MGAAVVLLSGGLDSTVSLVYTLHEGAGVQLVLTADYGQRAAERELESARAICEHYGLPWQAVNLRWLGELSDSALNTPGGKLVLDESRPGPQQLWVPNRNGVLVNVAAAYAEQLKADTVVVGFNADEAERFPDNTLDFAEAATEALRFSTLNGVQVSAPTARLHKSSIASLGRKLGAPLELAWPCYEGGSGLCWECTSCRLFKQALEEADCWDWYCKRLEARGGRCG